MSIVSQCDHIVYWYINLYWYIIMLSFVVLYEQQIHHVTVYNCKPDSLTMYSITFIGPLVSS